MPTSYQLTADGLSVPRESEIVSELQAAFSAAFGAELNVDVTNPDSIAGRLIGILAEREAAIGELAQAVYASRRRSGAVGEALDVLAELRGIDRNGATRTSATVTLVGTPGAIVSRGTRYATDSAVEYVQSETVTLDGSGDGTATVLADVAGAVPLLANGITTIVTAVAGLSSATNASAGVTGRDEELDAPLRVRLDGAGAVAGSSTRASIAAALGDLDYLSHVVVRENDTETTDSDGVPRQYLAIVIYPTPDDDTEIGELVLARKGDGTGTYGSTTIDALDSQGEAHSISYTVATTSSVAVTATVGVADGYTDAEVVAEVEAAIAAYFAALEIGQDVQTYRLIVAIGSVEGVDAVTLVAPASDQSIGLSVLGIAGTVTITPA